MLEVRGLEALDDNYIWLAGRPGSQRVMVVDPGDAEPVLAYLSHQGLALEAILITHHHGDHTAGIGELLSHYPVPVFGPSREAIPRVTDPVHDGQRLTFSDGSTFQVLETPGHTRGHICFHGEGVLFCGDTLFTAGCGRLFEGTPQQMSDSLDRILALPAETLVYCAHEYTEANLRFAQVAEPANSEIRHRAAEVAEQRRLGRPTVPATLDLERRTNPFLRCRIPHLIAAAEAWVGHPLTTPAEVFRAVRAWKDALD